MAAEAVSVVVVQGNAAGALVQCVGTHRANGRDLTFPDGRKLFLGSSGTGAPYELTPAAKTQ
jgi:hypothetical protein